MSVDAARRLATSVVGLTLGVLGVALGLGRWTGLPWEPVLVLLPLGALTLWRWQGRRPLRDLTAVGVTSVRALLLVSAVAAVYTLLGNVLLRRIEVESGTASSVTPGGILVAVSVAILVGGLLTALPEELVFRGVLLRASLVAAGPAVAVVGTAVLFGLLHLPNAVFGWEVTGSVLVSRIGALVVIGVALAWATLRSGTIWVAIAWHGAVNVADTTWSVLLAPEIVDASARELWRWVAVAGEAVLLVALVGARWPSGPGSPRSVGSSRAVHPNR